jgi:hypothetical protein
MIFGMKTPLQWTPPYSSLDDRSSANAPATKNGTLLPGAAASGRAKLW